MRAKTENIVINEKLHAEKMLETGFQLKPQYRRQELSILYKYFISLFVKKDDAEKRLHDFCRFWLREEYNYVKFIKIIESVESYVGKTELKKPKRILYTKEEIDVLKSVAEDSLRRVLFVIMFFGKVDGFNYCNAKESEIFKIARMNVKPDDRKKFMRELCNRGYIRPTMTGGDKVLCADERLLLEDGSENWIKSGVEEDIALVVEDVHQPIFAYWEIFGGTEVKIGVCAGCGKKIIKNSNRQKFCVS